MVKLKTYKWMTRNDIPTPYNLFYIECGEGWNKILNTLFKKINNILKRDNFDFALLQVKEKYGGLRIYVSSATDEIYKLIDKAESESFKTCEICGKKGKIYDNGWVKTRCKECKKKEESGIGRKR